MNNKEFLNSLGDIDDTLVREAAAMERAPRRRYAWTAAAAAAALVVLAVGALLIKGLKPVSEGNGKEALAGSTEQAAATEAPVGTDAPAVTAIPGGADDAYTEAIGEYGSGHSYLIFNGFYYEKMADIENRSLAGERIGEVTKLLGSEVYFGGDDFITEGEAPSSEGVVYEEHTGSMLGAIYALQDYPTEYIVCQKTDKGVRVYFSIYRQEYRYGRDILENCFGVSSRFKGLTYMREQHLDRIAGKYTQYYSQIDAALYGDRIDAFMNALLNAGYSADPAEFPNGVSTGERVAYLRIELEGGMYVNVLLYENGHAWIHDIDGHLTNGVLCLDKDAAEGIAELVRGKLVFTEYPVPEVCDFEDAVNDPELGRAMPQSIPDGLKESIVKLYKCSYYELEHSSGTPKGDADDPTRYMFVQLRAEDDDSLLTVNIDVFNRDEERYFVDYAAEPNEFIPIDDFDGSDIRVFWNDPEAPTYGAFIRVGEVSARIIVISAKGESDLAREILTELVNSING